MTDPNNPHDCCAPKPEVHRLGKARAHSIVAALGAIVAGFLASACCWLPLALLAVGASAAGVSAFFDHWRPAFVSIAVVLLGIGFWYNRRKAHCAPGSDCVPATNGRPNTGQYMLLAAAVIVAVVASFPLYGPSLLRGFKSTPAQVPPSAQALHLQVTGMTCESCAVNMEEALQKLPDVTTAHVDYRSGKATITWAGTQTEAALRDEAIGTIHRLGYVATSPSR